MTDFEEMRDAYLTGKIWNVGDIVEANGAVGEVVRKGTNYLSFVTEDGKVHKAWLHDIKERNYAKEYANYQGTPEQIARRSSRNKARRVMGDKTKIGMDVGHRDNDPLNNDPKNLRNEDPSKNRREPRLRSEEENLDELHQESWYIRFSNWIDTHIHKKEFGKLAKEYVNLVRSNKKYKDMPTRAISDVARGVQGVNSRELANYINDLVKKGVLPQDLKAEFDPSEEKISSFKSFIDQINNK